MARPKMENFEEKITNSLLHYCNSWSNCNSGHPKGMPLLEKSSMIFAAALFHSVVRHSPEVLFTMICFALVIIFFATVEMVKNKNRDR